ncbi:hypothetical protein, partial [Pseudomonas aeruginosa]|uniref:hypothetical protein n=1 Tax=Pseudomonas aeruginosa TaxID=287 RepID=UPI001CD19A5B
MRVAPNGLECGFALLALEGRRFGRHQLDGAPGVGGHLADHHAAFLLGHRVGCLTLAAARLRVHDFDVKQ